MQQVSKCINQEVTKAVLEVNQRPNKSFKSRKPQLSHVQKSQQFPGKIDNVQS